ncbi:TPA: delta-lysin family phenol-soluble modulin [Staphylococcus aureus]|nr:delta-lysin family phenol-soluble modulin [Staphylococcus aureus]HDD0241915.1 delta-lysin family phenol-soluble modulin [Staphylococcus aureus]HDD0774782.1 delta-lysin family phenol-soluble modulin [Staphylococcus aureus]HDD0971607.1 delta-lysin family phenol-soluble modulin [Staphylococcus aureus]HDD1025123.1 delta-lysin family phenol-soluble modulin [Staphylococcus aureus]
MAQDIISTIGDLVK